MGERLISENARLWLDGARVATVASCFGRGGDPLSESSSLDGWRWSASSSRSRDWLLSRWKIGLKP